MTFEKKDTIKVSVRLPRELVERIDALGWNRSKFIIAAVQSALERD